MKEILEYLNEEERELMNAVEVYLKLNNYELFKFGGVFDSYKKGEIYRYIGYKDGLILLTFEYSFVYFRLDYIFLGYRFKKEQRMKYESFYSIRKFKKFLMSVA